MDRKVYHPLNKGFLLEKKASSLKKRMANAETWPFWMAKTKILLQPTLEKGQGMSHRVWYISLTWVSKARPIKPLSVKDGYFWDRRSGWSGNIFSLLLTWWEVWEEGTTWGGKGRERLKGKKKERKYWTQISTREYRVRVGGLGFGLRLGLRFPIEEYG